MSLFIYYLITNNLITNWLQEVKQSVSTRWNSQLTMLQSVLTNIEDITTLSAREQHKKLQRKLFDLNETLLKDVITVLTPFDTTAKHLSTDKECSLHMVAGTKYQITKHLQVSATDSNIIKDFKTHINDMMKRYFPINEMHRIATLLDPKFKRIATKIMTEEEIKETLNSLNNMVDELPLVRPASFDSNQNTSLEPPEKKRKIHNDNSSEFFVNLFESEEAAINEVDSYWNSTDSEDNISSYWKSKTGLYPNLSQVAQSVLSIPATSTSSERSFSIAGRTLDNRRTQLHPDCVDGLLFLHGLNKE